MLTDLFAAFFGSKARHNIIGRRFGKNRSLSCVFRVAKARRTGRRFGKNRSLSYVFFDLGRLVISDRGGGSVKIAL